jgi:hypothetical protein
MPAKDRVGKKRRPSFDDETLALFVKLEGIKARNNKAFKAGDRELMYRLGLSEEFWTVNSVLNRGPKCHPDGYIANIHWEICKSVREELLAAVRERTE